MSGPRPPVYHNPNSRTPDQVSAQQQARAYVQAAAQTEPVQEQQSEERQEPQERPNLIALPQRQPEPQTIPVFMRWMLAVAGTLAACAFIAYILSQVDDWDDPRRIRYERYRREGREHRRYDDDDDMLDDWFPRDRDRRREDRFGAPERREREPRARDERQPQPAPTFNVHLPGGFTAQAQPQASNGGQS